SRIESTTERPALTPGKTFTEEISEVLQKRTPKYQKSALHKIETDQKTPLQVAEKIVKIWNNS
ncbi:MAG: shikimate kinase, partial [Desulfobulbaceae bacterium]|nr:shikimate kinase [Desulfobulbaceae bacterium]